jgi:fumarate reductase subunit D
LCSETPAKGAAEDTGSRIVSGFAENVSGPFFAAFTMILAAFCAAHRRRFSVRLLVPLHRQGRKEFVPLL